MALFTAVLILFFNLIVSTACQHVPVNDSFPIPLKIKSIKDQHSQCPSTESVLLSEIKEEVKRLIDDIVNSSPTEASIPAYPPCCSGNSGEWMQVAYFNMSNSTFNCPENLMLYETPRRSCGRGVDVNGCVSTTFNVGGQNYNRVCGRITGYQFGPTTAFYGSSFNIESRYLNGVSLTYGSPRRHIWSFAAALGHFYRLNWNCPCTRNDTVNVPSFINDRYFCETGTNTWSNTFYQDKPLWDGKGCESTSTCCQFNSPPWFCQELSEHTTENIEMRLCSSYNIREREDTPLELIELYIQ